MKITITVNDDLYNITLIEDYPNFADESLKEQALHDIFETISKPILYYYKYYEPHK